MRNRCAFFVIELIVVTAVVGVAVAATVVSLSSDRTTAWKMQNSTQLRGMHQGMFTYANANKENFPGLNARGDTLDNGPDNTGNSGNGETTEARIWILLRGHYFTPEYAIAPVDNRASEYDPGHDPTQAPVTFNHYSYAMLDIAADADNRRAEWTQSCNTQAVVVSDRNTSDLNEQEPTSIWNPDAWHGSVLWNDNHVAFEETQVFETRYGNGFLNVDAHGEPTDDLFTIDTNTGAEAYMTFSRDEDGSERAVPRVVEDE